MSEKQKLIGVDDSTKQLIDKNYSKRGFTTRAKYLKSLVEIDTANHPEIEQVNPEHLN
jgi:hypothetical protein